MSSHHTSSKTGFMIVMLLLLSVLSAACGSNERSEPSAAQPSQAAAASESSASPESGPSSAASAPAKTTRTVIDDLNREVEVPLEPKRIVAGEFAPELLTLGIKPIASGDNGFKVVYTLDQMEGVERIGDPPNPETIVLLSPDLVVAPTVFLDIYPDEMEKIAQVAPVYYLSYEQDPVYGIYRKLAELVGQSAKADSWIEEFEKEAEQARETIKSAIGDETVSIVRIEKGRLRVYLNRNFAGYMVRSALKLPAPEEVDEELIKTPFGSAVQISLESLPEFAGDHLFVIVREEGDDNEAFREIEESGLWKSLDAVKNGKLHFLDTDSYYGSDIVTIRETMKEAADMLAAAPSSNGE
ncbi:ABC transporter substrate-binding protein [Cohnella fermenti]|uniref:Fe/B12 periplasmic-binding domain-containing protein n=1 Tax=Cohnella fermenti TaxID=2565925 RepID=A0A4S4BM50_9BACL|nr:ABC transporter substrate-binding protein [Cohnella fermenti]THF75868.1 hypothetical protein E6C55_20400 [Cohnella fermenti]